MVKVFYLLKRKRGMSAEEFHTYWRDVHGPLFWNCTGAQRHVLRYEQHHVAPASGASAALDGISVFWFESVDAIDALHADPEFLGEVIPDGQHFLDPDFERIMTDGVDVFDRR